MATLTVNKPDVQQHCPGQHAQKNRVAAWCVEIARAMQLPPGAAESLRTAVEGGTAARALLDLNPELHAILEHVRHFDSQLEYAPFEDDEIGTVLTGTIETGDPACSFVLSHLRKGSCEDIGRLIPKLPVYPAVAIRILNLLSQDDVGAPELEKMAKSDGVLAGNLLKVANSAYFSPREPMHGLAQAISYIGMRRTRQSFMASSVHQLFTKPRMLAVWKHSLEAAEVAERIAGLISGVDPQEAFLLGLLHDVGRLLVTLLPEDTNASIHRLVENGCQASLAELVLCGFDHAEAGAETLRKWNFSDEWQQAIKYHHQPERSDSVLPSLLYLTEFWVNAEEDLPSNFRLRIALDKVGISLSDLEGSQQGRNLHIHELLGN